MTLGDNAVEFARLNHRARLAAGTEANAPKEALMHIQAKLAADSNKVYAKRLGKIIERLERWQNTP